ncbi:unnamed protein product [Cyclocybe aegerita]|uniref:Uncharacterized protein n=1 Tax=Cyclocybe aegerita TaxID=1973307 RepID=A0A8S0WDE8_CYCAE|nr:unnamed protein product [Cyclocybe aegerita]
MPPNAGSEFNCSLCSARIVNYPEDRHVQGIHPDWEQVRFKSKLLSRGFAAVDGSKNFAPGDIAHCSGSIEQAFYQLLHELRIPLQRWERQRKTRQLNRFCIVNRHIANQQYEVFLLTTFGGSRNVQQLGLIARYFGMPMGDTQWIYDTAGIRTFPHVFGSKETSFVFAIPVIASVGEAYLKKVKLATGELERLRAFAKTKRQTLIRDHREIRESLFNRHQYKHVGLLSPDSVENEFLPHQQEEMDDILSHEDYLDEGEITAYPEPTGTLPTLRLRVPIRHDIGWLLKYASRDVFHGSKFNCKQPLRYRRLLPLPYYSTYLRIGKNIIKQLIR